MNWPIINRYNQRKEINDYVLMISQISCNELSKRLCIQPPLGIKPINLYYNPDVPITYWPLNPNEYNIGLHVDGIYPHQIIYQISHELCHIYIDPRINGPFIEIMCQKTAIDLLEDIGAPFTSQGSVAVDNYILEIKEKVEKNKGIIVSDLNPNTILNIVQKLEENQNLYDRDTNDLIAFKLKEIIDPIDKYGLIKYIKNSIYPPPPLSIYDLTTNDKTKINLDLLISNISQFNKTLADTLNSLNKC